MTGTDDRRPATVAGDPKIGGAHRPIPAIKATGKKKEILEREKEREE